MAYGEPARYQGSEADAAALLREVDTLVAHRNERVKDAKAAADADLLAAVRIWLLERPDATDIASLVAAERQSPGKKMLAEALNVDVLATKTTVNLDCGHTVERPLHDCMGDAVPGRYGCERCAFERRHRDDEQRRLEAAIDEAADAEATRDLADRGRAAIGDPEAVASILRGKTRQHRPKVVVTMGDGRPVYVFGAMTERPWEDLVGSRPTLVTETVTPEGGGVYVRVAADPWALRTVGDTR